MSPEPTFLGALVDGIAIDLTKNLLAAGARAVRRRFDERPTGS